MKHRLVIAALVGLAAFGWSLESVAQENAPEIGSAFVGAIICRNCHGPGSEIDAFTVWSVSKHSRTWVQLGTRTIEMVDPGAQGFVPEALGGPIVAEARRQGIDTDCLQCHTTGHGVDPAHLEETFHPEDGVQCEACHGPGRRHVDWMEEHGGDNQASRPAEAHMRVGTVDDCTAACHRPKPTHDPFMHGAFDPEEAWGKIAHGLSLE